MSTAAHVRPVAASQRPPVPLPPTRHEIALDALVTLWDQLEAMGTDDARAFLLGPAASFLLGVDVGQVLAALHRDRTRREARR